METGKEITYRRLIFRAIPELWGFNLLSTIILAIPASLLTSLISYVADRTGTALTTANFKSFLTSWQIPVLALLGLVLIVIYISMELFAFIYLSGDILTGQPAGIRREIARGFTALRKFLTPTGILVLLYIVLAVPLCGIGFSISLTESLYVPNFIMDVVLTTPTYMAAYLAVILFLIWIGARSAFTLHAVLLDGMTPGEGRKESVRIVTSNKKAFILGFLKILLSYGLLIFVTYLLFSVLPALFLDVIGESLPKRYVIDILNLTSEADLSETDYLVIGYRMLCAVVIIVGSLLNSIAVVLGGSFFMLRFTRLYYRLTGREPDRKTIKAEKGRIFPDRPKRARYRYMILLIILSFVLSLAASVFLGLFYDILMIRSEPAGIIAHRVGGTLAPENSLEGIDVAASYHCYGCETDVQRTRDGYYIINHDDDFKRLAGVARKPKDMTLEEIRQLTLHDVSGKEFSVPTIEELLEASRGKVKLFIELKGETADRQMVDDLAAMIHEYDCVDNVALISLNYDVIDYAESKYPEFETGTLFFAGVGNISKLNCDLLIMEEETATNNRVNQVHEAEKQAIVWTVNREDSLFNFLDSNVDAVITDEIDLAQLVQDLLDDRTDLEVMEDNLEDFWMEGFHLDFSFE